MEFEFTVAWLATGISLGFVIGRTEEISVSGSCFETSIASNWRKRAAAACHPALLSGHFVTIGPPCWVIFQMAYESSLNPIANVLPVATNRARSPMLTSIHLRKLKRYPPYICQIALAMGQVWHYHLADMGRAM